MPLWHSAIYCDITCRDAITTATHQSDFKLTKDTQYLDITIALHISSSFATCESSIVSILRKIACKYLDCIFLNKLTPVQNTVYQCCAGAVMMIHMHHTHLFITLCNYHCCGWPQCKTEVVCIITLPGTVHSQYFAVSFLQRTRKGCSIAHP